MRYLRFILPVFPSLFCCGAAVADWESFILPGDFQTESSLAQAIVTAKRTDKHVIVYYTRTNCPPCNVLRSRLRSEVVARPYRDSYVFTVAWGSSMGSVERDQYRQRYRVLGAPTWLVFANDGRYVCTAAGGFQTDEGGQALHQAIQAQLPGAAQWSDAEPRNCL